MRCHLDPCVCSGKRSLSEALKVGILCVESDGSRVTRRGSDPLLLLFVQQTQVTLCLKCFPAGFHSLQVFPQQTLIWFKIKVFIVIVQNNGTAKHLLELRSAEYKIKVNVSKSRNRHGKDCQSLKYNKTSKNKTKHDQFYRSKDV